MTTQNLLTSPGFEDGYYHWNNVPEMAIPNGWDYWHAKQSDAKLPRQDQNWDPPEIVVWNIDDAPPEERTLFFRDGSFCLKGFGGWKAIWFSLFQDVSGLQAGDSYRFTVPIYPDLVVDYTPEGKVFAPDPLSGEVRMTAVDNGKAIADSGWMDGNTIRFGQYNILTLDFAATSATIQVKVECRGRWGLRNNGWFLDALKLEALDESTTVSTPASTPTVVSQPATVTAAPTAAPTNSPTMADATPTGDNLLTSPGFEDGYYHWNNVPEMAIPNGWDYWHAKQSDTKLPRQSQNWDPPEMVVWNRDDAPEWEKNLFFRDGQFTLKGFGGWKAIWFNLFQDVSNLQVGGSYRFTVPVYPDLVAEYTSEGKVFAPDPLSGEVRLTASTGGEVIADTGWMDGGQIKFGEYNILTLDFAATAAAMRVQVDCRGRWGLQNNGWFLDALELKRLDVPAGTGAPTPAVSSGDGLANGEFDGGVWQPNSLLRKTEAPNGWDFWYASRTEPKLPGQEERWREPNAMVITPQNAQPDDMDAFVEGVQRVYAVVGPWRAIWFALSQQAGGLESGQRYRLTAKMYPDPVASYGMSGSEKNFDTGQVAGEIWLKSVSGGQATEKQYIVNRDVPPGRYSVLTHEFTANGAEAEVKLEVRSRNALTQNAWYIASIVLDLV